MDGKLPVDIERHLESLGILAKNPLDEHEDKPHPNVFELTKVQWDEKGEPHW